MRARLRLHAGALLIALCAPLPWVLLMLQPDHLKIADLRLLVFAVPGIVAAQIAAWLCWRALVRRVREGRDGWPAGLGMAVLTHLLFGALVALALFLAGVSDTGTSESSFWMVVFQALFFALMSFGTCGLVTVIATALLAQHVAKRLRLHELAAEMVS